MSEMSDKIAALKAAHAPNPQPALYSAAIAPAVIAAMLAAEPPPSKHRLGILKTHPYSKRQWAAMRKRRKQANAAKRRNRRG